MSRRIVACMFLASAMQGFAQTPEKAHAAYRADANLVLVPVVVTDRRGALVNVLRVDEFSVFEDKVSERISSFSEQDAPASIGVILDMSGSMRGSLAQAEWAVRAFLDTANPEDEGFLYSVSSRPGRDAGFTEDLDSLLGETGWAGARGSTALIDTVYCGLDAMRSAHRPRRALLIVSDGMDNHSRYSKTELLERALEADVQIYTIAINGAAAYEKAITLAEQRQGTTLLEDLAEKTGGLSFVVRSPEEMGKAALAISRAIRNEYTIAYAPGNGARDGKWHGIRVRLSMPGVRVYARSGYYAQ